MVWREMVVMSWLALAALGGCQEQTSLQALAALSAGRNAFEQGDYQAATRHMNEFLAQSPKSKVADEAYYYRGRSFYQLGDAAAAKVDMRQAVSLAADNELRASAMIVLGDLATDAND